MLLSFSLLEKIKDGDNSCLPRHFAKRKREPAFQNSQFYSQNFPSHIPQDLSRMIFKLLKMAQEVDSQITFLGSQSKIRVLVLSRNLGFPMVQSSLIVLYTFSSIYMPSFKTHSANLHSQKLHLIYSQLQRQNGHFTVKSQNFWSTSYFESTIIILSSLDHDSTRIAQKSSRCKSYYFWTVEKSTVS